MEIFGIPTALLGSQLLVGLINGSFYAILSLGLAIIFGLLNIINFAHGAQYMMGAFIAWMALTKFNVNYWVALIAAPTAGRPVRGAPRTHHAAQAVQARPPLRPAADFRLGPDHRGRLPRSVRHLR
jgi:branched-subunit amino acid ABC-type transport system permease component